MTDHLPVAQRPARTAADRRAILQEYDSYPRGGGAGIREGRASTIIGDGKLKEPNSEGTKYKASRPKSRRRM